MSESASASASAAEQLHFEMKLLSLSLTPSMTSTCSSPSSITLRVGKPGDASSLPCSASRSPISNGNCLLSALDAPNPPLRL